MTAEPIVIAFSGEPHGKGQRTFNSKTGFAFTPAKTRTHLAALRYAAEQAMAGRAPIDGPIRIEVTATFPIPASWPQWRKRAAVDGDQWCTGKPDADNILKAIGDGMNAVVWRDDSVIVQSTICKRYGERPGLIIVVEPLPAQDAAPHRAKARPAAEPAPFPLFGEEAEAPLFARGAA